MQSLKTDRNKQAVNSSFPALIDAKTATQMRLGVGSTLNAYVTDYNNTIAVTLRVVAVVPLIPTAGDTSVPGVLVDYPTFASNYLLSVNQQVLINHVWLKTTSNATMLISLHQTLSQGELRLVPLYDRRAIETAMFADPVYRTLLGELELGAATALLLAVLGNLVASWLSVRARLTNFQALRALGAAPRQVISTLAWEQSFIYTAAVLLGILVGALLATLSLSALVSTSVMPNQITGQVSNSSFFAAQFVPPLQVSIPLTLWLVLGGLVVLLLLALGLMMQKIVASSLSMVLRLNED
jgi:hypothetical protein